MGLRTKPLSTTLASQPLVNAESPSLTSFPNHSKTKENDLITSEKLFTLNPTITPILHPIHTNRVQDPILLLRSQVLLVEDNEINLKLLVMYMRKLKFSYRTAVNGLEAFQLYKEHYATLRFVITDISMPVMDGMVSTLEMRRFEKEKGIAPAIIVALTGVSSIKAREKVVASGVDKFFTKPMPLATVKELLLQAGLGRDA